MRLHHTAQLLMMLRCRHFTPSVTCSNGLQGGAAMDAKAAGCCDAGYEVKGVPSSVGEALFRILISASAASVHRTGAVPSGSVRFVWRRRRRAPVVIWQRITGQVTSLVWLAGWLYDGSCPVRRAAAATCTDAERLIRTRCRVSRYVSRSAARPQCCATLAWRRSTHASHILPVACQCLTSSKC